MSPPERLHGKPIDMARFKRPVLEDIQGHLKKIQAIVDHLAQNETPVEQDRCFICGARQREPLVEIHGFSYVTCFDCGHIYTTRRYSDEAIHRFYSQNVYWAEVTYANRETCFYRRDHVARPKLEFAMKHMPPGREGLWLEVGAGIGDMVSVAQEAGWRSVGLELSRTSVRFAQETFNVTLEPMTLEAYIATHPQLPGTVAMVSMVGVLEHVVDPMGLLSQAVHLLQPGGVVMIQVPNGRSMASMVQMVFPENVFRHMSPMEHIQLFTQSSLDRALDQAGLEPLAYWYHGMDFYELLTNLVMANPRVRHSPLYDLLMETMNDLQQVMDDREWSDRIICVAQKKKTEIRSA